MQRRYDIHSSIPSTSTTKSPATNDVNLDKDGDGDPNIDDILLTFRFCYPERRGGAFAHFQRHPHLRDRSDQRLYGHAFVIFEELKQARDVKSRFSGAPFFVLSPASGGNVACVAGQHPVSLRK